MKLSPRRVLEFLAAALACGTTVVPQVSMSRATGPPADWIFIRGSWQQTWTETTTGGQIHHNGEGLDPYKYINQRTKKKKTCCLQREMIGARSFLNISRPLKRCEYLAPLEEHSKITTRVVE